MVNDMHLLPHRSARTLNLARIRHLGMRHILHRRGRRLAHASTLRLLPDSPALGRRRRRLLPVRGEVEANEQEEVAAQDAHTREGGELLAGAAPRVRHPGEVGRGEVGVGGEVDESKIDDELQDLQARDVLLPPDLDAAGGLEVVPVHDDVDEEVEGDGHPGDGGEADELSVAEEGGGAVVVGVQKREGFFLEDHEDCVEELEVFGEVVELSRTSVRPLVEKEAIWQGRDVHNTA